MCVNPFSRYYPLHCMLILLCSDRVQRLKDARTQATKEIEEYRESKDKEFKAFEASVCSIQCLGTSHSHIG